MTYLPPQVMKRRRVRKTGMSGLGDILTDLQCNVFGICDAPVIDVAPSPEDTTTSTTSSSENPASSMPTAPASNWVKSGGVCKPTNPTYLDKFKGLQRQANRVLEVVGGTKIAVDGAIGSDTLGALRTVSAQTSAGAYGLADLNLADCSVIAGRVDALTYSLSQLADHLSAPSSVSSPSPAQTPTYVDVATGQVKTQGAGASLGDMLGNMSSTQQLLLLAGTGIVGYLAIARDKRKRKGK